jgi:hypothetical protein
VKPKRKKRSKWHPYRFLVQAWNTDQVPMHGCFGTKTLKHAERTAYEELRHLKMIGVEIIDRKHDRVVLTIEVEGAFTH